MAVPSDLSYGTREHESEGETQSSDAVPYSRINRRKNIALKPRNIF